MKRKKEKLYGPVLVIALMIIFVAILSLILNKIGFGANKTIISNSGVENALVTVRSIVSIEGLQFIVGKTVSNFRLFEPLVLLIISLIGISICEKSGFLTSLFSPLRRVKLPIVIFITVLLGVVSTVIGDYSYIVLIPLVGALYKYLGKNPVLGVITIFLGITLGYGTGLIFNYDEYSLSLLTIQAAKADIDSTFSYGLLSNLYIMIASTLLISFLLTFLIDKFLSIKLAKRYIATEEEQELIVDKKAKRLTLFVGLLYALLLVYMILPINAPLAGVLLDGEAPRYIEKLFGPNAPFNNGLSLIIATWFILTGYVYGKKSGNIKNSHEFSLALSLNFDNLGFMFVLMFFISELAAAINWTNLGTVMTAKIVEIMGSLQVSGLVLIFIFFIAVILMSILMPSSTEKWKIASPVVVPLFMQSNITPNFTQFIFKVADGVGKAITPIYIYYIITLGFLEKYRTSDKQQVSIFGILADILPIILIMAAAWILIISIWYVMALPIGLHTSSTL